MNYETISSNNFKTYKQLIKMIQSKKIRCLRVNNDFTKTNQNYSLLTTDKNAWELFSFQYLLF